VTTLQGVLAGWAEAVDADEALILRTSDGQRWRVLAGDVTLRGSELKLDAKSTKSFGLKSSPEGASLFQPSASALGALL